MPDRGSVASVTDAAALLLALGTVLASFLFSVVLLGIFSRWLK